MTAEPQFTDGQVVAALAAYYADEDRAFSQASVDAMRRALDAAIEVPPGHGHPITRGID